MWYICSKACNPTKIYVENEVVNVCFIILDVILPILILMLIGAILQRKFQFNLKQLSTLITYCLMPAAVFVNIYDIRIEIDLLLQIIYYLMLYSLSLIIVSHFISKILKLENGESAALKIAFR